MKDYSSRLSKTVVSISVVITIVSLYILVTIDLPANKPLVGHGESIKNEVSIGSGDFALTDHNGLTFTNHSMKGRLTLIYFGFTFCPDICPDSLQKLTYILTILDKYHIDVLALFITIDPIRDNKDLLKEYLASFHPKLLGLTGTEEQISKVANLYKIFYAKVEDKEKDKNKYMMDHSSFVYLMDKNGKYLKHFYSITEPEEIVNFIRIHK